MFGNQEDALSNIRQAARKTARTYEVEDEYGGGEFTVDTSNSLDDIYQQFEALYGDLDGDVGDTVRELVDKLHSGDYYGDEAAYLGLNIRQAARKSSRRRTAERDFAWDDVYARLPYLDGSPFTGGTEPDGTFTVYYDGENTPAYQAPVPVTEEEADVFYTNMKRALLKEYARVVIKEINDPDVYGGLDNTGSLTATIHYGPRSKQITVADLERDVYHISIDIQQEIREMKFDAAYRLIVMALRKAGVTAEEEDDQFDTQDGQYVFYVGEDKVVIIDSNTWDSPTSVWINWDGLSIASRVRLETDTVTVGENEYQVADELVSYLQSPDGAPYYAAASRRRVAYVPDDIQSIPEETRRAFLEDVASGVESLSAGTGMVTTRIDEYYEEMTVEWVGAPIYTVTVEDGLSYDDDLEDTEDCLDDAMSAVLAECESYIADHLELSRAVSIEQDTVNVSAGGDWYYDPENDNLDEFCETTLFDINMNTGASIAHECEQAAGEVQSDATVSVYYQEETDYVDITFACDDYPGEELFAVVTYDQHSIHGAELVVDNGQLVMPINVSEDQFGGAELEGHDELVRFLDEWVEGIASGTVEASRKTASLNWDGIADRAIMSIAEQVTAQTGAEFYSSTELGYDYAQVWVWQTNAPIDDQDDEYTTWFEVYFDPEADGQEATLRAEGFQQTTLSADGEIGNEGLIRDTLEGMVEKLQEAAEAEDEDED